MSEYHPSLCYAPRLSSIPLPPLDNYYDISQSTSYPDTTSAPPSPSLCRAPRLKTIPLPPEDNDNDDDLNQSWDSLFLSHNTPLQPQNTLLLQFDALGLSSLPIVIQPRSSSPRPPTELEDQQYQSPITAPRPLRFPSQASSWSQAPYSPPASPNTLSPARPSHNKLSLQLSPISPYATPPPTPPLPSPKFCPDKPNSHSRNQP